MRLPKKEVERFKVVLNKNGTAWRCMDENGMSFGEYFQETVRSPECKASVIIFEKYKRKCETLELDDLTDKAFSIKRSRDIAGKKTSWDYLVQLLSEFVKKNHQIL